ncbi:hypothetical protein TNIN_454831 [Trichonephila inaurata madagascariensis]|uniref:Uncharacterized protein n=1 Tax=Trichonephila inaurata madagascariensis TaxID=2747483 RepID=A0A8X7C2X6_9ARAC|nr:hypothetical protein TNIN_454831 [Trichonephila inaurata madagascariensis]
MPDNSVLVSMDLAKKNSIRTLDSTEDGNNCGCRFWSILAIKDIPQWVHEWIKQSFSALGVESWAHSKIYFGVNGYISVGSVYTVRKVLFHKNGFPCPSGDEFLDLRLWNL